MKIICTGVNLIQHASTNFCHLRDSKITKAQYTMALFSVDSWHLNSKFYKIRVDFFTTTLRGVVKIRRFKTFLKFVIL